MLRGTSARYRTIVYGGLLLTTAQQTCVIAHSGHLLQGLCTSLGLSTINDGKCLSEDVRLAERKSETSDTGPDSTPPQPMVRPEE